ncbi:hypothetical protein E2K98_13000 [Bacillus salipaludis]|uniref:Uncharacterized protein n=1 Tax=Bacillus salipaludis TaxID=2547811 RepID=A0A4R5VSP7_9BACI|nr:hypothetical protein [Bacillus salipaludis]TDK61799.1 hypothetical protein E2K98_13000 [Bacillus salipaludis]
MSNITWVVLGALLLSIIDFIMFNNESKRWKWFAKKPLVQRVGLLCGVFIAIFLLNYVVS